MENRIKDLIAENKRLKAELAAERERVGVLQTALASILAQRPDKEICHEIARNALADTPKMTLDDHTRMAFGEEE